MYSKNELREIKKDFWSSFGQFSQLKRERLGYSKKWLLYKTKLKGLELKFILEKNKYLVAIEINSTAPKAQEYISKIELLKNEIISLSAYPFLSESLIKNNKSIHRFFFEKENLNFKNKLHWPDIFNFFFDQMIILEQFVVENKAILE